MLSKLVFNQATYEVRSSQAETTLSDLKKKQKAKIKQVSKICCITS
jgi:hypothetical protein